MTEWKRQIRMDGGPWKDIHDTPILETFLNEYMVSHLRMDTAGGLIDIRTIEHSD